MRSPRLSSCLPLITNPTQATLPHAHRPTYDWGWKGTSRFATRVGGGGFPVRPPGAGGFGTAHLLQAELFDGGVRGPKLPPFAPKLLRFGLKLS